MQIIRHGTLTRAGIAIVALMIADMSSGDTDDRAARNMRRASETSLIAAYYSRFPAMRIWRDHLLSEGRSVL